MLALQQKHVIGFTPPAPDNKKHTTLYDVIEAVAAVTGPGEEALIGPVVMQLLRDYRARVECGLRGGSVKTKGDNRHLYLHRGAEA